MRVDVYVSTMDGTLTLLAWNVRYAKAKQISREWFRMDKRSGVVIWPTNHDFPAFGLLTDGKHMGPLIDGHFDRARFESKGLSLVSD